VGVSTAELLVQGINRTS